MIVPLPGGPTVHPTVWVRSLGSEIETKYKRLKKTLLHASTEPEQSRVRQKAISPRENGSRQLHNLRTSRRAAQALQDAADRVRWMAAALTAIRSSGEVARARRSAASKRALVLGAGAAGAACTGVLFFLVAGRLQPMRRATAVMSPLVPRIIFSSHKIALMAGEV